MLSLFSNATCGAELSINQQIMSRNVNEGWGRKNINEGWVERTLVKDGRKKIDE